MKTYKACGWILQSPSSRTLLLQNAKRGDWGVPKGHVEAGESEQQTALRELEEETGLSAEQIQIDDNFREEVNYMIFKKSGRAALKHVVYFKAQCDELNINLSDEHKDMLWATKAQVVQKITYNNLRHVILESFK